MMSDNDIRKDFQAKLNDFEVPPPMDGWDEIERSLKAAAFKASYRRRWYAGSAAAILLLLVGSILFLRNPMERASDVQFSSVIKEPSSSSEVESEPAFAQLSPAIPEQQVSNTVVRRNQKKTVPVEESPAAEVEVRPSSSTEIVNEWLENDRSEVKEAPQMNDVLLADEVITIGEEEELLYADELIAEDRSIVLAVGGRGGLTGYQQMVNSPVTLRSVQSASSDKFVPEANKNLQMITGSPTDNISEMEHNQPISFGVTVSKHLFDNLSIETGIVYSYLYSKSRNTNNSFEVNEVQKLHYLGVPVNLNYNILSVKNLNLYASVGGMIEKDVYGEFRKLREGQTDGTMSTASEGFEQKEITKISQRNPQVSVNVGFGLSYPLYDRLRLYGKIGGAYYFDAENEYKTIYSDRKIVMDLNVGLRYEF